VIPGLGFRVSGLRFRVRFAGMVWMPVLQ